MYICLCMCVHVHKFIYFLFKKFILNIKILFTLNSTYLCFTLVCYKDDYMCMQIIVYVHVYVCMCMYINK